MRKTKESGRYRPSFNLIAIIKGIETAILITVAIYKGVKLVIEEVRSQCVAPESNDDGRTHRELE